MSVEKEEDLKRGGASGSEQFALKLMKCDVKYANRTADTCCSQARLRHRNKSSSPRHMQAVHIYVPPALFLGGRIEDLKGGKQA